MVICYNLFEIAKHSEVQNKIREEIQLVRQKHNDCITYEAILDMTYLDCVVTGTLNTLKCLPSVLGYIRLCSVCF